MDGPGYGIVMSANSELDERLGEEDLPRQWSSRYLDDLRSFFPFLLFSSILSLPEYLTLWIGPLTRKS